MEGGEGFGGNTRSPAKTKRSWNVSKSVASTELDGSSNSSCLCHLFPDTYAEKDGRCISCAEKQSFASAPNHIAPFVLYKVNVYTAFFEGPSTSDY